MNNTDIKKKAELLHKQVGGTIFAFPINEDDPFSEYAVVVFSNNKYHVYPRARDISHAAVGINTILNCFSTSGKKVSFDSDVRFVSYEAQMNAPSVTMRRLKNDQSLYNRIN